MLKCVWSPDYEIDIGDHVFPTAKYRLIREMLLEKGVCSDQDFLRPEAATQEQLLLAHTAEYLADLKELHRSEHTLYSELPLNHKIIDAYRLAAGGTILAARTAVEGPLPVVCHIGGGFHHAFANHAEGFCYINDIAVAIRVLQHEGRIKTAAVIDCDLHQGNGTAHIFLEDPTVTTFSIHQENNYPTKQNSDYDIGLDDYADDIEYISHLQEPVVRMLDNAKPDLLIYVAGADPYQDDVLGRLKVTIHGLLERDEIVLGEAVKRGIPVATVTAGGYARHTVDTVTIHAQTCEVAAKLNSQSQSTSR